MRVISVKKLREYWEKHTDAKEALQAWMAEAQAARWQSTKEIKARYPNASILPGSRVVFDIKGNSYRLIVKIHYNLGIVYIR